MEIEIEIIPSTVRDSGPDDGYFSGPEKTAAESCNVVGPDVFELGLRALKARMASSPKWEKPAFTVVTKAV